MADFIIGDYQYYTTRDTVRVQVVDTTKSSYEPLNSIVVYNNITYTVTNMRECFKDCTNFNQLITIPNSVTNLKSCFENCTSFNQLITIPNSVTNMNSCFYGCINFNQSIIIPNSVINMDHCFSNCTSFNQSITIPNSVNSLINCFSGCTSFNQLITIPNSVTDMTGCFSGCTNFNQSITIPNLVTHLTYCFKDCTSFNQLITISNSVTDMSFCFWNCTNFNQLITIPNSVISMDSCFRNCTSFNQSITIPNSVTSVSYCFYRCTNFNQSIIIPNSVTNMSYCFYYCINFNQPITIPNSVTNMYCCFEGCTNFNQSITIPNSVIQMGYCFCKCTNFNQPITIPNSVIYMTYCFYYCTSLSNNIIVNTNNLNSFENIFTNTSEQIYIIAGSNLNSTGMATWKSIASNYSNVHFETDDHAAPSFNIIVTRGKLVNNQWEETADGTVIQLKCQNLIITQNLPYGYTIAQIDSESIFIEKRNGQSLQILSYTHDSNSRDIIYIDLNSLSELDLNFLENLNNQFTIIYNINDGYKTGQARAVLTRVGALLDFLGNQNPNSPFVDEPGMGMAIGTIAIRNGLDIEFPTTIGNGLIPPTQPIFSENPSISTDTNIQLDKNYYVLGGEKYYKVNIIKGTTEENNETVEKPFILTKDSSIVSGKIYYETDDRITFETLIPSPDANPVNEGWYEEDTRSPYDNNWYAATQEAVDLNNYQLTIGDYNLQDPGIQSMYGDVALIIGNGTDDANRSNAVTIGKDGLVGAYINYDTDTPGIDPETGQYFTRFAIINSNNNKVTYMDAHKWSGDRTLGVFGAQRKFEDSPDPVQNQFGLGIDGDKSLYVWIPDNAKEAWNEALNADYVTSQGTSGIWRYRKWASGVSECWGMKAAASYAVTGSWGNGFYASTSVSYPSDLFIEAPTVSMCKGGAASGLQWLSVSSNTATTLNIYVCDSRSGTYSFPISIQAKGRWK